METYSIVGLGNLVKVDLHDRDSRGIIYLYEPPDPLFLGETLRTGPY